MLKGSGLALDIASGEGRNAVFAAENGYQTLAVDISAPGTKESSSFSRKKRSLLLKLGLSISMTGKLVKIYLILSSVLIFLIDEYFQRSKML